MLDYDTLDIGTLDITASSTNTWAEATEVELFPVATAILVYKLYP